MDSTNSTALHSSDEQSPILNGFRGDAVQSQSIDNNGLKYPACLPGGLPMDENQLYTAHPKALKGMLRTTTETGDIGQFAIKQNRVPQNSRRPANILAGNALCSSKDAPEIIDDRRRLPSYTRDVTSETASYETMSQKSIRRLLEDPGYRSLSMTQTSTSPYIPNYRSYSSLRSQDLRDSNSLYRRPHSPFAYPSRLKRPGFRPFSPALTDGGLTDYSRRVEIDRTPLDIDRIPYGSPTSPSSLASYPKKRTAPPSIRSDGNRSTNSLLTHSPLGRQPPSPHATLQYGTPSGDLGRLSGSISTRPLPTGGTRYQSLSPIVSRTKAHNLHKTGQKSAPVSPMYYDYSEDFEVNGFKTSETFKTLEPEPLNIEKAIPEDRSMSPNEPRSVRPRTFSFETKLEDEQNMVERPEKKEQELYIDRLDPCSKKTDITPSLSVAKARITSMIESNEEEFRGNLSVESSPDPSILKGCSIPTEELKSKGEKRLNQRLNATMSPKDRPSSDTAMVTKEILSSEWDSNNPMQVTHPLLPGCESNTYMGRNEPNNEESYKKGYYPIANPLAGGYNSNNNRENDHSSLNISLLNRTSFNGADQKDSENKWASSNATTPTEENYLNPIKLEPSFLGGHIAYSKQSTHPVAPRTSLEKNRALRWDVGLSEIVQGPQISDKLSPKYMLTPAISLFNQTPPQDCEVPQKKRLNLPFKERPVSISANLEPELSKTQISDLDLPRKGAVQREPPILAPKPISPARQLKLMNSVPELMKALPATPTEQTLFSQDLVEERSYLDSLPSSFQPVKEGNTTGGEPPEGVLNHYLEHPGHPLTPSPTAGIYDSQIYQESSSIQAGSPKGLVDRTKPRKKISGLLNYSSAPRQCNVEDSYPRVHTHQDWNTGLQSPARDENSTSLDIPKFRFRVIRSSNSSDGTVRINNKAADRPSLEIFGNTRSFFDSTLGFGPSFKQTSDIDSKKNLQNDRQPSEKLRPPPSNSITLESSANGHPHLDLSAPQFLLDTGNPSSPSEARSFFSEESHHKNGYNNIRKKLLHLRTRLVVPYILRTGSQSANEIPRGDKDKSAREGPPATQSFPKLKGNEMVPKGANSTLGVSCEQAPISNRLKVSEWLKGARSAMKSRMKLRNRTRRGLPES